MQPDCFHLGPFVRPDPRRPCILYRADAAEYQTHGRCCVGLSCERATEAMDAMESKMAEWKKRMPSKRQLTSAVGQFVQQKSVAVLYTPQEQDRIKRMTDLIAKATSAYDSDEDWERILKVVDALSNASNKHVYVAPVLPLCLHT